MPLDGLVGAPDFGDPRIRLKPQQVKGRTVIPLTRTPGGLRPDHLEDLPSGKGMNSVVRPP